MAELTPHDRLRAAALADRLIYGRASTFHRQDAIDLLAMLPEPRLMDRLFGWMPGLELKGSLPGRSMAGAAAAGVGNVSARGEEQKFELDSWGRRTFRAGQWRLYRTDKPLRAMVGGGVSLTIEQVMGSTSDDARTAHIEFRRGEPARMLLNKVRGVGVAHGLWLSVGIPEPWKTPVDGLREEAELPLRGGGDRSFLPLAAS